ncbi:hypothetical protein FCM35_KLT04261 [Carex littledalei]|uniref:Uncharacterized protein n=1 Tax=Carex littledalei TaxID=544730 RepID=A0A833R286_9POAL|nr:hypothetical protein FCM35_KLT04261 [Carex littledalei]
MSSGSRIASLIRQYEAQNEKSLMECQTTSPNKIDNTKVTNTSPRSVFSKTSSCISFESSDTECSSLTDQLSSDLCLSREDIWVSSLDLDEENSELIEEEQDYDSFDAYFPSPSFNARSACQNFCKEELHNSVLNSDTEEPIFWPFDYESYRSPDLDKFLSISPRRNMLHMDKPVKSGLDPIRVRLHQKSNGFKGVSECERKIVPNSEPSLACTAIRAQQIPNMPSRLGRLSNGPSDLKDENPLHTKCATGSNRMTPLKNLIGLRTFKEGSIEKSIGLHEFDGHEGIEELRADNEIPLCGSPWQITSMMKIGAQKIKRRTIEML